MPRNRVLPGWRSAGCAPRSAARARPRRGVPDALRGVSSVHRNMPAGHTSEYVDDTSPAHGPGTYRRGQVWGRRLRRILSHILWAVPASAQYCCRDSEGEQQESSVVVLGACLACAARTARRACLPGSRVDLPARSAYSVRSRGPAHVRGSARGKDSACADGSVCARSSACCADGSACADATA